MLWNALILFGIVLAGIYLSCKVFGYEITTLRKVGAAGVFVILNIIPIGFLIISFLIPLIGLYLALMDNTYQRSEVNKVFGLTFVFAVVAVLVIYLPQQG